MLWPALTLDATILLLQYPDGAAVPVSPAQIYPGLVFCKPASALTVVHRDAACFSCTTFFAGGFGKVQQVTSMSPMVVPQVAPLVVQNSSQPILNAIQQPAAQAAAAPIQPSDHAK